MITLPHYIIERFENVWYIYCTDTCVSLPFETKELADQKLKQLK